MHLFKYVMEEVLVRVFIIAVDRDECLVSKACG